MRRCVSRCSTLWQEVLDKLELTVEVELIKLELTVEVEFIKLELTVEV